MSDILTGFAPTIESTSSSDSKVEEKLEDTRDDLHRAKKKLKKAKKKGKGVKKLKKKIEKLKAKSKKLERKLQDSTAQPPAPYRGRWDSLIEKSVPEAIKLANTIVKQVSPPPVREVVYVQPKRQPQSQPVYQQPSSQPIYQPPSQPVYYLPSSPVEVK